MLTFLSHGQGQDHFLSCSVTEISKSFMCTYIPLIKKQFKESLARNSECVSSSTRTNSWKLFAGTQVCILCSDGCCNRKEICPLSPRLCSVSSVSGSSLSLVPLPTIWPENQVPVKGKILNLGRQSQEESAARCGAPMPNSPMLNSCWEACRALVNPENSYNRAFFCAF